MALVVTKPEGSIGNHVWNGDVVLLDVDSVTYGAPTRQKPWYKFDIRAVLPLGGYEHPGDVRWLVTGAVKLYVVAEFPDGTFDRIAIEAEQDAPDGGVV